MSLPLRVVISKDLLTAYLDKTADFDKGVTITFPELNKFLQENKINYGIDKERLQSFVKYPHLANFPYLIAEGLPAKHGEDGYLVTEIESEQEKTEEKINFRNIMNIPSVQKGEVIARIISPTNGVNGKSVTGRELPARNGKPLRVRAGKNVTIDGNQFIALEDGQVSMTNNIISVNPVFEVRGDLDMKVGNINFIGNVIIRGNVPTGYQVVAGGDIKIYGLVEGAQLVSKGNIYISGGITGGNRAKVVANGTISASYINQADVKAGQDVLISSSCLHSRVEAKGTIDARNATIIGGELLSGKDVYVKELGNHLYTKTEVTVGYAPNIDEREKRFKDEKEKLVANINKLQMIENKIVAAAKQKGTFSEEEKALLLKQKLTKKQLQDQLSRLELKLDEIEMERNYIYDCKIIVYNVVYPNSLLRFGKYMKTIQTEHSFVKFFIKNNDITFEPI